MISFALLLFAVVCGIAALVRVIAVAYRRKNMSRTEASNEKDDVDVEYATSEQLENILSQFDSLRDHVAELQEKTSRAEERDEEILEHLAQLREQTISSRAQPVRPVRLRGVHKTEPTSPRLNLMLGSYLNHIESGARSFEHHSVWEPIVSHSASILLAPHNPPEVAIRPQGDSRTGQGDTALLAGREAAARHRTERD